MTLSWFLLEALSTFASGLITLALGFSTATSVSVLWLNRGLIVYIHS